MMDNLTRELIKRYITLAILIVNVGCTTEQIYAGGQAWQREQCRKIADEDGNKDCMTKTNRRYDDYQYETDKAIK